MAQKVEEKGNYYGSRKGRYDLPPNFLRLLIINRTKPKPPQERHEQSVRDKREAVNETDKFIKIPGVVGKWTEKQQYGAIKLIDDSRNSAGKVHRSTHVGNDNSWSNLRLLYYLLIDSTIIHLLASKRKRIIRASSLSPAEVLYFVDMPEIGALHLSLGSFYDAASQHCRACYTQ